MEYFLIYWLVFHIVSFPFMFVGFMKYLKRAHAVSDPIRADELWPILFLTLVSSSFMVIAFVAYRFIIHPIEVGLIKLISKL